MWIFAKKKERKKDAFLIRFTVWLNNPFSPVLIPGKSTEAEDETYIILTVEEEGL